MPERAVDLPNSWYKKNIMRIEAVNVIEVLDGNIQQVIVFHGDCAEAESRMMFEQLILEHNDPENDPPINVLGFEPECFNLMWKNGKYDDENGYSIHIVHSI